MILNVLNNTPVTGIKQANDIVGGLSKPSKMPCYGYSLPAKACKVGARLNKVKGSTCYGCYALKGRYGFSTVQNALGRRLEALNDSRWVEAMVFLIQTRKDKPKGSHFRWHDSGDLQSLEHLENIVQVAQRTSSVKHWLPTREYGVVKQWLAANPGGFPENLTVRLSAHMIDGKAPDIGLPTSTVHKDQLPKGSVCPAPRQGGQCGDCRSCWDKGTSNVSYHVH